MYILHGFEHKSGLLSDNKTPWENYLLNFTTDNHDGSTVGHAIIQQKFKPEMLMQAFNCRSNEVEDLLLDHFGCIFEMKYAVVKGAMAVTGLKLLDTPQTADNPSNNKK